MQTAPSSVSRPRYPHGVALVALAVLAASIALVGTASAASPNFMRIVSGSIGGGQGVSALSVQDQSGTQDTWLNYIEFMPDATRHISLINTRVAPAAPGQSMTIDLNFRGPKRSEQPWIMNIRNRQTNAWERIWLNGNAVEWVWTESSIVVENADQYLDVKDRVLLRWLSPTAVDVGQLDYLNISLNPVNSTWSAPAGDAKFDYQIGQAYTPESGVQVVSRDWFDSDPEPGAYNVCYINAFQTQDDSPWVDRPDEQSNWPQNLVLYSLGDDPNWGGEYLIDISTNAKRIQASAWVTQMVQACADKGYDGIEWDNLDSWTRFDGTPLESQVPFDKADAIAYAKKLTQLAHDRGLASAQKNTADLTAGQALNQIGFDFAVVESCGVYNECPVFTNIYGDQVVAIEYSNSGFSNACAAVGSEISVVRRDVFVTAPGSATYIYDEC